MYSQIIDNLRLVHMMPLPKADVQALHDALYVRIMWCHTWCLGGCHGVLVVPHMVSCVNIVTPHIHRYVLEGEGG